MIRLKPLTAFLTLLLAGCNTMNIAKFEDRTPRFVLEEYFAGQTKAWGIFEDRFGNLRREFVVDIEGNWDGRTLILEEDFTYADGETDTRIWHIEKVDANRYQGRADDVIGTAEGESAGNAFTWKYRVSLLIGGRQVAVTFDDWMFQQDDQAVINRAKVTKFGVELGEVTIFFFKSPEAADMSFGEAAE
jgi:hypothetical protein